MYTINRAIAIVKPKKPYIDWANNLPDAEGNLSESAFQKDLTYLLIPEYDDEEEARAFINGIYDEIFEQELYGWCTYEKWWPKNRTQKMFWDWFTVEFHSEVFDPSEEVILKEEL